MEMSRTMLSVIRRNEIKKLILEKQNMTVAELSRIFDVSDETIRRDLRHLEEEGIVSRTYGGALLQKRVKNEIAYNMLEGLFVENKRRIARKCAEFIHNGDSIFLDFSTTALYLCNEIAAKKITVISNSIKVQTQLSSYENITLISTGGGLQRSSFSFVGRTAVQALKNFYADRAFVSCRSLSTEKGLSDGDEQQAEIRRMMIQNSNQVYVIADHTKFDKVSFVNICGFEDVDAIVVDTELGSHWHAFCAENKIALYECGEDEDELEDIDSI
jgi:DeoR/GlpR family transcriptional regulator of sugar metabolism